MMLDSIKERNIPDFFGNIKAVKEWEAYRAELIDLFLREEYGYLPPKITPTTEIVEQAVDFAGKAHWQSVLFTFENNGKKHTVKTELILPSGKKRVPVFVNIGFVREIPNKYLPTEEIIDSGFGVLSFCYEDVTSDNGDFSNGLCALFDKCECGKISIWAYMASRCVDYLYTREEIDKEAVAVIGHSRLGKTALLASALDKRFVLCCANNSGCCGASLSRGKPKNAESIKEITRVFPFWFVKGFEKYNDNPHSLPFDQHMLIALSAPRYVMLGCAKEDVWADNEGALYACRLASRAWNMYEKQGLVLDGKADFTGSFDFEKGEISIYQREGKHFLSRADWQEYMKKFNEILRGKNELKK